MSVISEDWIERKRPVRLERRFEFDDYEGTREFLDKAEKLSEAESYYPDLSFSRTHVSVALHCEDGETELSDKVKQFAMAMDKLIPGSTN